MTLLFAAVAITLLAVALFIVVYYRRRRRKHAPPSPAPTPSPPTTPPTGLPPCEIPPDRVGNVLKGVYSPDRLQIISDCSIAKGTVKEVRHEPDGDTHIRISPVDADSPAQPQQGQDFLICEIVPVDQALVPEPKAGDHVACYGPNVHDRIHNWDEVHPVWRIVAL